MPPKAAFSARAASAVLFRLDRLLGAENARGYDLAIARNELGADLGFGGGLGRLHDLKPPDLSQKLKVGYDPFDGAVYLAKRAMVFEALDDLGLYQLWKGVAPFGIS